MVRNSISRVRARVAAPLRRFRGNRPLDLVAEDRARPRAVPRRRSRTILRWYHLRRLRERIRTAPRPSSPRQIVRDDAARGRENPRAVRRDTCYRAR